MRRLFLTLLIALAAAVLAVAPASAQFCDAPPGTSAVDQYCENPPSASGNSGGGGGGGTTLKPSGHTVRVIAKSGERGKELNRYLGQQAASSGGSAVASNGSSAKDGKGKGRDTASSKTKSAAQAPSQQSTSPLGAVQSAASSGSTIGNGFIWALIAIALFIAGTAFVRHRRKSAS